MKAGLVPATIIVAIGDDCVVGAGCVKGGGGILGFVVSSCNLQIGTHVAGVRNGVMLSIPLRRSLTNLISPHRC